jgi:hypothetical protein
LRAVKSRGTGSDDANVMCAVANEGNEGNGDNTKDAGDEKDAHKHHANERLE